MKKLLVGYRAADLNAKLLEGDVTCHVLDIYHRHAIEKVHHIKTVCSPHLPPGPWDSISFHTGPKIMAGELELDLMQEIADLLNGNLKSPRFQLDYVGRERDRNDLLEKMRDYPKRRRSFRATWQASVPGGSVLDLVSYPGCFCHRRTDAGGLALAEVVSRELAEKSIPADSVLDMGCGCGLVGLLIAEHRRALTGKAPTLVMVDSHSRAIEAANENSSALGIDSECILADSGTPDRMDSSFDIFVGNPPYYSEYRIAEVFLATAQRALKPGGVAYTVVKNADGLKTVQERFFPKVEVIARRGYSVLKSVKE